jgi:hypothetical protein
MNSRLPTLPSGTKRHKAAQCPCGNTGEFSFFLRHLGVLRENHFHSEFSTQTREINHLRRASWEGWHVAVPDIARHQAIVPFICFCGIFLPPLCEFIRVYPNQSELFRTAPTDGVPDDEHHNPPKLAPGTVINWVQARPAKNLSGPKRTYADLRGPRRSDPPHSAFRTPNSAFERPGALAGPVISPDSPTLQHSNSPFSIQLSKNLGQIARPEGLHAIVRKNPKSIGFVLLLPTTVGNHSPARSVARQIKKRAFFFNWVRKCKKKNENLRWQILRGNIFNKLRSEMSSQ